MKRKIILVFLLCSIGLPTFGYQQQGFSVYKEEGTSINTFTCEKDCFLVVGNLDGNDKLSINGTLGGNGVVGYGFLINGQIVPGEAIQINAETKINSSFQFTNLGIYSQIPANAQVMLIVQGNVKASTLNIGLESTSLGDQLIQGRKDFWTTETLTPYSINLRYGVRILGTSIIQYGYRAFIVIGIGLLIFSKKRNKETYRNIAFCGLGIFLFIGMRNLISYTNIVHQGISEFSNVAQENKRFFDLGDYISFTDKIRKALSLDTSKPDCKIQVNSFQDRPFTAHRQSLYLKPCTVVKTGSEADYIIYYKKPITGTDLSKSIIVNFNGNYLLNNK